MEKAGSGARRALSLLLAGLQAGMIGALLYLFWMGVASTWQRRSFWTPENLMASVFYGPSAIRRGLGGSTLSGLALYLILYSLLGALFALAAQNHWPRRRLMLVSVVFALCWYYLSFHFLWKAAAPLMPLLYSENPTILGHLIYGLTLARYPAYLPGAADTAATPASEP